MRRYPKDEKKPVKFVNFKIIAASEADKKELLKAFRYIHNLRCIDTGYVAVNQLAHLYLDEPENPCRIIVEKDD